jgi:hypothetical protein
LKNAIHRKPIKEIKNEIIPFGLTHSSA